MVRKMDNRSRGSPVLRLERISMRSGRLQVLTDIDPSREQAAIVGLIAPNGAGKSTLSNGITSLYKPDEGDFFCGVGSFRFGLQAADCRAMVEGGAYPRLSACTECLETQVITDSPAMRRGKLGYLLKEEGQFNASLNPRRFIRGIDGCTQT
jgi:energy-coupling factor transporter ATP-binding protein EcfA2